MGKGGATKQPITTSVFGGEIREKCAPLPHILQCQDRTKLSTIAAHDLRTYGRLLTLYCEQQRSVESLGIPMSDAMMACTQRLAHKLPPGTQNQ
jgi:hypothetical protein